MKLQKTLLAAALAVVGFGVQAAETKSELSGLANVYKYAIDSKDLNSDAIFKLSSVSGDQATFKDGWYQEVVADGKKQLVEYKGDTAAYKDLVSGGQLEIKTKAVTSVTEQTDKVPGVEDTSNIAQNNYWVHSNSSATTTTTTTSENGEYEVIGKLVNYDENGRATAEETSVQFDGKLPGFTDAKVVKTEASLKKDVQIGNLTKEDTQSNANYDFKLNKTNDYVEGLVATIKTAEQKNTAVAAVTGNGLAVLDVPAGAIVDLEKGTVTSTKYEGEQKTSARTELVAYDAKDGSRVVSYGSAYYTLDADKKSLTTYTGDVKSLSLVGAGTAEETTGGKSIS